MKDLLPADVSALSESFSSVFLSDSRKELSQKVRAIFDSDERPENKISALDNLADANPELLPLSEYWVDLVTVQEIVKHSSDEEDFLDSPEWEKFEEKILDRGSELLNFLIYLRDCGLNNVPPTLEDFLYEFLLVEEEDFQDEFFIYEPFITHLEHLGESAGELKKITVSEDSQIKDIFIPAFLVFGGKMDLPESALSGMAPIERALFFLLKSFAEKELA